MKLKSIQSAVLVPMLITIGLAATAFAQESSSTRGRRIGSGPVAEATITVNEQFLNSFLTAMFDNLNEPAMPLTMAGARSTPECASEIRLKREVSGVRTAVRLENGKIIGSLAFAGAYNASLVGCVEFSGWADTEIDLSYDGARRALVARFRVRDLHLNNTPAVLRGPLLGMVQEAIDRRYNPVEVITLEKVSTRVDVQPAGGALQLRATEIRPEITATGLTLHIFYQFGRG